MRKKLLLIVVFIFALNSVCFAAVGGSKVKMSSPSMKSSTTQTAPASSVNSYKPSASPNSYSDKAPASSVQAAKPANTQSQSGGFLRKAALFGGGMLLGGLLGNMLGFGAGGMFASIIGMLVNIAIVVGIFMVGRYLWRSYKDRQAKRQERAYYDINKR